MEPEGSSQAAPLAAEIAAGPARRTVCAMLAGGMAAAVAPSEASAQQWPYWPGNREQRAKRDAEQRERRERDERARARARSWSVLVPRGARALEILDPLPWVRIGPAAPIQVYEIGFHRCPPCQVFSRTGADQLVELGLEVRSLVFAPPVASSDRGRPATPNELAAVAAIYRSRAVADIEAFYADRTLTAFLRERDLEPPARGADPPQGIEDVRAALRRIVPILDEATDSAWGYPAFLWRNRQGEVHAGFGWGSERVPSALSQLARGGSRG